MSSCCSNDFAALASSLMLAFPTATTAAAAAAAAAAATGSFEQPHSLINHTVYTAVIAPALSFALLE
jgi:hypothetical protein